MQEELDELAREIKLHGISESGQTIFPQDSKCKFELSKLKLTVHPPLLCRSNLSGKMGWVLQLQNHRNRKNGNS